MTLTRSRTITLVVALSTLSSNVLSSVLFSQLPDDPYHLAGNFGWYLHFANILSLFGFIGSLRQHALSVAIFANYLLLDTVLCAMPRFILLILFQPLSTSLCAPPPPSRLSSEPATAQYLTAADYAADYHASKLERMTSTWTPASCYSLLRLAQLAMAAGVIAGTVLQFVGALFVREYGRDLWIRGIRKETARGRTMCSRRWLPAVEEYADDVIKGERL